jgi:glyoxylase-like metal-dependent hydrolase (beta-lactamase superfamily II)
VRILFEDSVVPVEDQMELWSDDHRISESLRLRPAPGHTPGSSVVWLDAGRPAVFVGDLTHCPIQIARPLDPCAFDVDAAAAAATRKRVFTEAARARAAVIPAHYPGRGGATIVARGDRFEVDDWLELAPIWVRWDLLRDLLQGRLARVDHPGPKDDVLQRPPPLVDDDPEQSDGEHHAGGACFGGSPDVAADLAKRNRPRRYEDATAEPSPFPLLQPARGLLFGDAGRLRRAQVS